MVILMSFQTADELTTEQLLYYGGIKAAIGHSGQSLKELYLPLQVMGESPVADNIIPLVDRFESSLFRDVPGNAPDDTASERNRLNGLTPSEVSSFCPGLGTGRSPSLGRGRSKGDDAR